MQEKDGHGRSPVSQDPPAWDAGFVLPPSRQPFRLLEACTSQVVVCPCPVHLHSTAALASEGLLGLGLRLSVLCLLISAHTSRA